MPSGKKAASSRVPACVFFKPSVPVLSNCVPGWTLFTNGTSLRDATFQNPQIVDLALRDIFVLPSRERVKHVFSVWDLPHRVTASTFRIPPPPPPGSRCPARRSTPIDSPLAAAMLVLKEGQWKKSASGTTRQPSPTLVTPLISPDSFLQTRQDGETACLKLASLCSSAAPCSMSSQKPTRPAWRDPISVSSPTSHRKNPFDDVERNQAADQPSPAA